MSRILQCPVPGTINPLNPNGFMFQITRIPEVSFFCQEVNLPSVSLPTTDIATPFSNYPVAGDKLDFSDLNVQFLIDADMRNYKAVFDWIRGLGFPENNQQYTQQTTKNGISEVAASTSDATLAILGGGSIPVQSIRFIDLVPVSLESIQFTTVSQDVQYAVGNATFKYAYYKFE